MQLRWSAPRTRRGLQRSGWTPSRRKRRRWPRLQPASRVLRSAHRCRCGKAARPRRRRASSCCAAAEPSTWQTWNRRWRPFGRGRRTRFVSRRAWIARRAPSRRGRCTALCGSATRHRTRRGCALAGTRQTTWPSAAHRQSAFCASTGRRVAGARAPLADVSDLRRHRVSLRQSPSKAPHPERCRTAARLTARPLRSCGAA